MLEEETSSRRGVTRYRYTTVAAPLEGGGEGGWQRLKKPSPKGGERRGRLRRGGKRGGQQRERSNQQQQEREDKGGRRERKMNQREGRAKGPNARAGDVQWFEYPRDPPESITDRFPRP